MPAADSTPAADAVPATPGSKNGRSSGPDRRPLNDAADRPPTASRRNAQPFGAGSRIRSVALRAGSAVVSRLPEVPLTAVADAIGEAWFRAAPTRAAPGRLNLARVCTWLVAHDMASERVRAAAADPRARERLLRAAFRHSARYYLEVARAPTMTPRSLAQRLIVETPDVVDLAIGGGPAILVGLHFGAVELPAMYFAHRSGIAVTIPMETMADPGLQAWFERSRGSTGIRIVGLREAHRELQAALRRGEPVGLVGDRDLTGGGIAVDFFGARASLPVGPGLLAIESGAPVYVAAVRRTGRGRYRGRVEPLAVPTDGSRRERLTAFLAAEAHAFERAIAYAPEQWWALFFPIWPDLVADAAIGHPGTTVRRRPRHGPTTATHSDAGTESVA